MDIATSGKGSIRGKRDSGKHQEIKKKAQHLVVTPYGLSGFQFGESLTNQECHDHIEGWAGACDSLAADVLQIEPEKIGLPRLSGKARTHRCPLSIAVGARGRPHTAAHYEPFSKNKDGASSPIINLTRRNGRGSVAHEWGHFFDNTLAHAFSLNNGKHRKIEPYVTCGDSLDIGLMPARLVAAVKEVIEPRYDESGRLKEIGGVIGIYGKGQKIELRYFRETRWISPERESRFLQHARKLDGNKKRKSTRDPARKEAYWHSPLELFARCFEAWVEDELRAKGKPNSYLVCGTCEQTPERYPQGQERTLINQALTHLFSTCRAEGLLA
jgi:hypothetical protein